MGHLETWERRGGKWVCVILIHIIILVFILKLQNHPFENLSLDHVKHETLFYPIKSF